MLNLYVLAFIISTLICVTIIFVARIKKYNQRKEEHWIHNYSTSRAGGLAVLLSFSLTVFLLQRQLFAEIDTGRSEIIAVKLILFACFLLFLVGFIEDVIFRVSAISRLVLTSLISILSVWVIFSYFNALSETFWFYTFGYSIFFVFFCILVLSFIHGTNMIDGLNGLASGYSIITLLVLAQVLHDHPSSIFILLVFSTAGFVVCNFPRGQIFLGDGGAYAFGGLFGLLLVWTSLNESFSTFTAIFSAVIYPFIEVIWTALRRYISNKKSIFKPDGLHLHSLLFDCLSRRLGTKKYFLDTNSITSSIILTVLAINGYISSLSFSEAPIHIYQCGIFISVYITIYRVLYSENKKYKDGIAKSKSIP